MIYTEFEKIPPLQYDLIMADPPWNFRTYSSKGNKKGAGSKYPVMSLEDIKALPVSQLAAPNCALILWATNPMLRQAIEVMDAWCFTLKTAGHWAKVNPETNKLAMGTGYYLRCAGEPFLLGTIGRVPRTRNVKSVILGARRAHSQKPEEAFAHAESLAPGPRLLELFSRQERPGWDQFGNEVKLLGGGDAMLGAT